MEKPKQHGNAKPVVKLDFATKQMIEVYPSAMEASLEHEISWQNIAKVCNGKRNKSAGFGWMWLSDYEREANG